jgi:hypothetical protein
MFERKFEFTVYHPLEVCEKRLLEVQQTGYFMSNRISIRINAIEQSSFNVSLSKALGRDEVVIQAIISQLNSSTSRVSGVASTRGIFIVSSAIVGIIYFAATIYFSDALGLVGCGVAVITAALLTIPSISSRDHLIDTLKNILTQPKKK